MTVRELTLRMGERELARWQRYAVQRGFPSRRAQLQAALTAMIVARSLGGAADVALEDFVIGFERERDERRDDDAGENAAAAFGALSGRGVRVLGQKRKRR